MLMAAFAGMGSGASPDPAAQAAMQENMMKTMCSMHDGMVCVNANPTQCAGMFEQEDDSMSLTSSMDPEALSKDLPALKTQCDAKGYATATAPSGVTAAPSGVTAAPSEESSDVSSAPVASLSMLVSSAIMAIIA